MDVFRVQARWTAFLSAPVFMLAGSAMFIGGAVPAFRGDTGNQTSVGDQVQATVVSIFSAFFFLCGLACLRSVHAIRLEDGGTITFVRAIGATRVSVFDVRQLKGHYARDYDGDQVWRMEIRYGRARLRLDQFPGVLEFAQRVEALNPDVVIAGLWPLAQPPAPRSGG